MTRPSSTSDFVAGASSDGWPAKPPPADIGAVTSFWMTAFSVETGAVGASLHKGRVWTASPDSPCAHCNCVHSGASCGTLSQCPQSLEAKPRSKKKRKH